MAKKALWATITSGVAAAAVAIALAFAVPAAAGTGGQAVVAGQNAAVSLQSAVTPDKPAVCDRLKKHEQNRQALQTRLSADANTRGSIAWNWPLRFSS